MIAPLSNLRGERAVAVRGAHAVASRGGTSASSASDIPPDQQAQLAAQHAAFDYDAAERAEIEREHEALQALLMAWLKNEDEIIKKWISLI